jgi:eukaryotic-like serine/threonine-protein kinase
MAYPADVAAHNNLAICRYNLREFSKAVDELQQVVAIVPNRTAYRANLANAAAFNSDFVTAEREARKIAEPDAITLIVLAFSQLGQSQFTQAAQTYQKAAAISPYAASLATSGLADLANVQGRFSDATRLLEQGIAEDLNSKRPDLAAAKLAALARTQLARRQARPAVATADKALMHYDGLNIRFMAARTFIEAGRLDKAKPLIATMSKDLLAEPRAYAKILEGEIALQSRDLRVAIERFTEANGLLDTWLGRFELGLAYLEAGQFPQADSEFDRCLKRRGETLQLVLNDEPTYAFLPPVYYYQGRVREGLKSEGSVDSYREYLKFRGTSTEDPLVANIRKRIGG